MNEIEILERNALSIIESAILYMQECNYGLDKLTICEKLNITSREYNYIMTGQFKDDEKMYYEL